MAELGIIITSPPRFRADFGFFSGRGASLFASTRRHTALARRAAEAGRFFLTRSRFGRARMITRIFLTFSPIASTFFVDAVLLSITVKRRAIKQSMSLHDRHTRSLHCFQRLN